jgi:hypothetical protein
MTVLTELVSGPVDHRLNQFKALLTCDIFFLHLH